MFPLMRFFQGILRHIHSLGICVLFVLGEGVIMCSIIIKSPVLGRGEGACKPGSNFCVPWKAMCFLKYALRVTINFIGFEGYFADMSILFTFRAGFF